MPLAAQRMPIAIAALVLACGGRTADAPPTAPEPPSDAGVEPASAAEVVIRDTDADAGPVPPPLTETGPPPAAMEPAPPPADNAAPAAPALSEDPLCERHHKELMAPPAKARPPIDCGRIDRIAYWKWTAAGGCRDVTRLSLRRSGAAVLERSGPVEAGARGAPSLNEKTIDPAESAAAIQAACQAFNEEYDPQGGIGCPAGSRLIEFFDGNSKSGRTEALPCDSRAMAGPLDRLDRLLGRL